MINYLRSFFKKPEATRSSVQEQGIGRAFNINPVAITHSVIAYGDVNCVGININTNVDLQTSLKIADSVFAQLGIVHNVNIEERERLAQDFRAEMFAIGWDGKLATSARAQASALEKIRKRYSEMGAAVHSITIGERLFIASIFNQ